MRSCLSSELKMYTQLCISPDALALLGRKKSISVPKTTT